MSTQELATPGLPGTPGSDRTGTGQRLAFTKMHGIGNDFLVVDLISADASVDDWPNVARAVCDRRRGVGADGLLLIRPPESGVRADLRMVIYNADGSTPEMCGNGIRCIAKYAVEHGLCEEAATRLDVQTGAGVLAIDIHRDGDDVRAVTVDMGEPILKPAEIPVQVRGQVGDDDRAIDLAGDLLLDSIDTDIRSALDDIGWDQRFTCISMGNPHVILFVNDIANAPLKTIGPAIEGATIFPNRTNVHLVQIDSASAIAMRTWERGAGVTFACGTGASAVCVAGAITNRTNRAVTATLPGGELQLRWDETTNHVFMTGPAANVFSGEIVT